MIDKKNIRLDWKWLVFLIIFNAILALIAFSIGSCVFHNKESVIIECFQKDSCLVINNGDTIGYFPVKVIKSGPYELTGREWWYNGGRGRKYPHVYETTETNDSLLKALINYWEFEDR